MLSLWCFTLSRAGLVWIVLLKVMCFLATAFAFCPFRIYGILLAAWATHKVLNKPHCGIQWNLLILGVWKNRVIESEFICGHTASFNWLSHPSEAASIFWQTNFLAFELFLDLITWLWCPRCVRHQCLRSYCCNEYMLQIPLKNWMYTPGTV